MLKSMSCAIDEYGPYEFIGTVPVEGAKIIGLRGPGEVRSICTPSGTASIAYEDGSVECESYLQLALLGLLADVSPMRARPAEPTIVVNFARPRRQSDVEQPRE